MIFLKNRKFLKVGILDNAPLKEAIRRTKMDPARRAQNLPKNERNSLTNGRFNDPLQLLENGE